MGNYPKRLIIRGFGFGIGAAAVGLYLGFSDGFDQLAVLFSVAGAAIAVVAGVALLLMRDPK